MRKKPATSRGADTAKRRSLPPLGALLAIALALAAVVLAIRWRADRTPEIAPDTQTAEASAATFVGSAACEACHPNESRGWRESHHAAAMAPATEATVRGRFDNRAVAYHGVTSRFFQKDGQFLVRTDGADGQLTDVPVKYTFGVYPLQQYLVELPGGRLQALSLAWDARPAASGGQRWFHLYSREAIEAGDPLHWTGLQQNWNFMCADCHSTNLQKGYDAASRTFSTTWSEISVGCEACHGPASAHVAWAREPNAPTSGARPYLKARLNERRGVIWKTDPATGVPARSEPRRTDREIEVCARCHSRREQITDTVAAGDPLADGFHASSITAPLFYADGQQREEVYTYASFLASKMYARGVTCSDCHDPHSGRLRAEGNAVCTQCHVPAKYDAPGHTVHPAGSTGAACVACHMPARTYMQIDPRRDHSFVVPQPAAAAQLGTPDVCTTSCHRNRDASWAADELHRRGIRGTTGLRAYAEVFHQADQNHPAAGDRLARLVSASEQPAVVRAGALERLAAYGLDSGVAAAALRDPSALVRRAALDGLQGTDPVTRVRLVAPLLMDPARSVRIQAAAALADVREADLPERARAPFTAALEEYIAVQRFNADRPESQTNLGNLYAARDQGDLALAAFREAIALDRTFVPAYINLADLLRATDEKSAEQVLRQGLTVNRSAADLHHALGLALVRQGRTTEALAELEAASRLAPEVVRLSYVYGVALHDTGNREKAIHVLATALQRHPTDRELLHALSLYSEELGRSGDARGYAERLRALVNGAR